MTGAWLEFTLYRLVQRGRELATQPLDTDTIEGIGIGRQSLRFDWPKGKEPALFWGTGVRVGIHD